MSAGVAMCERVSCTGRARWVVFYRVDGHDMMQVCNHHLTAVMRVLEQDRAPGTHIKVRGLNA